MPRPTPSPSGPPPIARRPTVTVPPPPRLEVGVRRFYKLEARASEFRRFIRSRFELVSGGRIGRASLRGRVGLGRQDLVELRQARVDVVLVVDPDGRDDPLAAVEVG